MKLIMGILHSAVSKKIPEPRGIKLCADSEIKLWMPTAEKHELIFSSYL